MGDSQYIQYPNISVIEMRAIEIDCMACSPGRALPHKSIRQDVLCAFLLSGFPEAREKPTRVLLGRSDYFMSVLKILVPYNFTVHEWRAFDFILSAFAGRRDVRITLFHAYIPLPEVNFTSNPEMKKLMSGMIFLSEELKKKELGLKSARDHFLEKGFSDEQVDFVLKRKEKDIADEIINAAVSGHYTVVVLTRTPGKVSRLLVRGVHEKLLRALKNIVICVAT
jgi:hypothetical protein